MKQFSQTELEANRPQVSTTEAINHCLNSLFKDNEKSMEDLVCIDLTFEELIGALLLARDDC
jgi:hypothetical protein